MKQKTAPISSLMQPSADAKLKTISLLLRVGLALVFAYAAIDAFREPAAWISFVPSFTSSFIPAKTALDLLSVAQLLLVLALLMNMFTKLAALAAIGFLAGLMIFNPATFLITFRDIGLIFAAAALLYSEL